MPERRRPPPAATPSIPAAEPVVEMLRSGIRSG